VLDVRGGPFRDQPPERAHRGLPHQIVRVGEPGGRQSGRRARVPQLAESGRRVSAYAGIGIAQRESEGVVGVAHAEHTERAGRERSLLRVSATQMGLQAGARVRGRRGVAHPRERESGRLRHVGVRIEHGVELEDAEVGPNVTLESGCVIRGSSLRDCILGEGVRVERSRLHDSLIGENSVIRGINGSVSLAANSLLEGDA